MATVFCIVEGHGEVEAVLMLIRRIGLSLPTPFVPKVRTLRRPASQLLQSGELENAVQFAGNKIGGDGGVFILLDCDDGCPAELGPALLNRACEARPDLPIAVVLAKKEYEAWFLASAKSLRGKRGLPADLQPPGKPEEIRDAKGWLSDHMGPGRSYSETTDQTALTELFDMDAARVADSFDKCYRELTALLVEVTQQG